MAEGSPGQSWNISNAGQVVVAQGGVQGGISGVKGGVTIGGSNGTASAQGK
jgi:hypothetical protein